MDYDILIVGGGASGLAAAVAAGRTARLSVGILERLDRVGKKLLVTGNGRCNITNRDLSLWHFHGGGMQTAGAVLDTLPLEDTLAFFRYLGVLIKFDETGRAYPYSLQASSVLDALRAGAAALGTDVRCGCRVTGIKRISGGFRLTAETPDGPAAFTARRVILATGGSAAPKLGSDGEGVRLLTALGHKAAPQTPAIVQLKTDTTYTRPLKGIKIEGRATLRLSGKKARTEAGEILFTDYGLSGPPVLQLSREAVRAREGRAEIALDCMPEYPLRQVFSMLLEWEAIYPERRMEDFFTGMLHKRLGQTLVKACGIPLSRTAGELSPDQMKELAGKIKDFRFRVLGSTGWANAQTTAGGVLLDGFSPRTLESRLVPGLYACGEALDVDGDCGGYNLQWAWASGVLAGRSAAMACKKR